MASSSIVYLISILSLIFIVQESSILVVGDAGLIQSTCQQTRLPDLCTSTLNADQSSQTADVKGLASIVIAAGETSAADTSKYILNELVKTYTDANAQVVTRCSTFYDNAKSALEGSAGDLSSDELDNAILEVAAASTYGDNCKNSFSNATPPVAYPDALAQRQVTLQGLCGVANDIIEVIRSSQP
ncbi:cell wall / vacuolar inhibitor of fructosidase 2-like [Papaver somniferum]|uniref:cell wall / vacuolar inhibitor of fructosidase 2-like n=1 Tax=Papaver somniferum TaxID=3469 RepID=UPI000E6F8E7E|nr:cell wall / vacuolar inhibitor of fructosidase 2-like [Papaver somniferum]